MEHGAVQQDQSFSRSEPPAPHTVDVLQTVNIELFLCAYL